MDDIIKKILNELELLHKDNKEKNHSGWAQIGNLDKADLGRRRSSFAEIDKAAGETRAYEEKIQAIKMNLQASSSEWWVYIKKKYGLPGMANLYIEKDGRILMEPKKEDPMEGK